MAYSPLGRGFLTGTIKSANALGEKDGRRNLPRFKPENIGQNVTLLEKMEKIADQMGITAAQLALSWLHSQGEDVFPIPGTKRVKYLEENVVAQTIKLSVEDVGKLNEMFPKDIAFGTRYPESALKGLGI